MVEAKSEIEQAIYDMGDINRCLYDLSMLIRTSARSDLTLKASAIDVSHFELWDIQHVQQKFPNANPRLVERLGKANCRRRQIFKYLQQHRAKFARNVDVGPPSAVVEQLGGSGSVRNSQLQFAPGVDAATWTELGRTDPATLNTQTTVNTFIEDGREVPVDDGLSETTSAASEGVDSESAMQLPGPPRGALDSIAFECPYCYEIMRVSSLASWR